MPEPAKGEKKQDYINRCVKYLIEKENKKPDQARAQCEGMWNQHQKNKRKSQSEAGKMIQSILAETAWLMEPQALKNFIARIHSNLDLSDDQTRESLGIFLIDDENDDDEKPYRMQNGIAIIDIHGPLIKRASGFFARWLGIKGMIQLGEAFSQAMDDAQVKGVFLDIDSPGGSADGTSDLSDIIFDARGKKPCLAFADGMMTSAAQWIGGSSDFVAIANETTRLGSVGVYGVHFDYSDRAKELGIRPTVFTAGKFKGIGNQFEKLKKEDKQYIQDQFDYLHEQFIKAVSRNSGIPIGNLNSDLKEAKVFIGSQAIKVGLGHRIMTRNQAMDLLSEVAGGETTFDKSRENMKSIRIQQGGENNMDLEAKIAELTEKLTNAQSLIKEMQANSQTAELNAEITALKAERDSLKSQLESSGKTAETLNGEIDGLKKAAETNKVFITAGQAYIEAMKADIKKMSAQVDGDAYNEGLVDKQLAAFGNDVETLASFKASLEARRSKMVKAGDIVPDPPKDEKTKTEQTEQADYELGSKIVPLYMRKK